MPPRDQILIGALTAVLSLLAVWHAGWLVENTRKGRWFARRFGDVGARRVVRLVFAALCVFGVLLATNVLRPIQW